MICVMAIAPKLYEEYEAEMKALGMRPVTLWVPDMSDAAFIASYRRQIADLTLYSEAEGSEFWEWMDKVQDTDGWV
jgi:hypothetical protein